MKKLVLFFLFGFLISIPVTAQSYDEPPLCLNLVDDPITYEELRHHAVYNCKNRKPKDIDYDIIDLLISIEHSYSPPVSLRGMLLAAACSESGFNPLAKGDYRLNKKGKKHPRAWGILQFWPWAEKKELIDRLDPAAAAKLWMKRIHERVDKVRKQCRYRDNKRQWLAAWVTAIRAPKKGGRCYEKPNHYKLLKRWHKQIRDNRRDCLEWNENDDGC